MNQRAIKAEEIVLRCSCCGLPYARLQGSTLVIQSKHHGEQHTNTITVDELMKLCRGGTPE